LSLIAAFGIAYMITRWRWKKHLDSALEYHFEFSCPEIFEGEYLYLDAVVINKTDKEISFMKLEMMLPEGLQVVLMGDCESRKDELVRSVQSVWVIEPFGQISRRWRLIANKRGLYLADQVKMHMISNDVLGLGALSKRLEPISSVSRELLVLPCAKERLEQMALSPTFSGAWNTANGLVKDPMSVCGIRDYEDHDPLNTVDWKQSARIGKMVVRKYEVQQNDSYNVVLNMQSVPIESQMPELSAPQYIEDCISICASLLDSATCRNIPVRLIANTFPDFLEKGELGNGEKESKIFHSDEYANSSEIMQAYRVLARIPLNMSLTVEQLMDDMLSDPAAYVRGGNVIMVTSFLNERMVSFHQTMKSLGINVIFYVVTSNQNASDIPSDVEVYYRLSKWVGGVGYGS